MYKVVAFLKDYLNLKRLETPIKIRFCTARQWLNQLGYIYRDIKKDVFVNGHERANVVEDRKAFLKIMLDLEPYLVEFDSKGNMKDKVYPHDCQVDFRGDAPVQVRVQPDFCLLCSENSLVEIPEYEINVPFGCRGHICDCWWLWRYWTKDCPLASR